MFLSEILVSVFFAVCSVLLAEGSSHEEKQPSFHKSIKQNDSKKTVDITTHGILLWASMGFLTPVGTLTVRMSNKEQCGRTKFKVLFYLHAIFQMLSVLLSTVGAVLSITNFENLFNNYHQRIGLALYVVIWVQALLGFCRPKRGRKGRSLWYLLHWALGTTISLVGILNIYTGLNAYHKRTSRSISHWTILFTAQISVMGFCYLFQDKWEYMQKQRVILGNQPMAASDQVLPQTQGDKQKEDFNETRNKSNALGAYFSRSNALKKLFQLT